MKTVTKFKSFDGVEFDDRSECLAHEKRNAHLRLVALTIEDIDSALAGENPEVADAIEVVGARLARSRIAAGNRKRSPKSAAEPRQITHQPEEEPASSGRQMADNRDEWSADGDDDNDDTFAATDLEGVL